MTTSKRSEDEPTKAQVMKDERAAEKREDTRAELEQVIKLARVRMEKDGQRVSVPVSEVHGRRNDGWVISGNQD